MTPDSVFDTLASDYDTAFSDRIPGRWLRNRTRRVIAAILPPASRVLDVGCGTGDDALWLAAAGHEVVATDFSQGMLNMTKARRAAAPETVAARVDVERLDLESPCDEVSGPFALVMSNFGAVNCCADLGRLFAWLDRRLEDDGRVVLTIMGRFCLWESIGFALRGRFRQAVRRWSGRANFTINGIDQPIWYHSPAAIENMAQSHFVIESICGIGIFVPSTEFFHICESRPRLMRCLCRLETIVASWWPFNRLGDHYTVVLRRPA